MADGSASRSTSTRLPRGSSMAGHLVAGNRKPDSGRQCSALRRWDPSSVTSLRQGLGQSLASPRAAGGERCSGGEPPGTPQSSLWPPLQFVAHAALGDEAAAVALGCGRFRRPVPDDMVTVNPFGGGLERAHGREKVMQASMNQYIAFQWPALSRCDSQRTGWCGKLNLRLDQTNEWCMKSGPARRWRNLPETTCVIELGIPAEGFEELRGKSSHSCRGLSRK